MTNTISYKDIFLGGVYLYFTLSKKHVRLMMHQTAKCGKELLEERLAKN